MNIALVAPTYLPARRANTIQVMKMAAALTELGHLVRVSVPGPKPDISWDQLARHYGLSCQFPVEWLPAHPILRRYDYGLRAVTWARGWGADLLYTRLLQAAALGSFLGMPTIYEIHDIPKGILAPGLFRGFLKGHGAYRLVPVSHALSGDLTQRFESPNTPPFTVVAPDGVDLSRYTNLLPSSQARRSLSLPDTFTAGYSGHLYAGRGVEMIFKMAENLPNIHFLLVGGEPEDVQRLKSYAEAMRLTNLTLTGFVPNAELPCYQAACDVLLMPYQQRVAASSGGDISRYLSPMKLFEYLACGRVILAGNLPVLGEVLNPENAILLPINDLDAWTTALRNVMTNPEHYARLSIQAKLDASNYTWEDRARRILAGLEAKGEGLHA
ncbi:MAG: glycosyltransferase [Chloroflexota bacterium]